MNRLLISIVLILMLPQSVFAVPLSKPTTSNRDTVKFYYDQSITKYSAFMTPFRDVSPWDEDVAIVQYFYNRGLIKGNNGNFAPDDTITRAEFVYLFASVKNSNLQRLTKRPFSDIPTNMWYSRAIGYTKELGLISGVADGNFYPNAPISLAAAEKILSYPEISEDYTPLTRIEGLKIIYNAFPEYRLYPKPTFNNINIS